MRNRVLFCAAAIVVAFYGASRARADETFSRSYTFCQSSGEECARFQGYIYVRRSGPSERPAPTGGSSMGDERLYVHAGAASTDR